MGLKTVLSFHNLNYTGDNGLVVNESDVTENQKEIKSVS